MGHKIELHTQSRESDFLAGDGCECPPFEVYEIVDGSRSGVSFMNVDNLGPVTVITLNKRHDFYNKVYLNLQENGKDRDLEILELLLLSYARALNEAGDKSYELREQLDLFNQMWGNAIKYFLSIIVISKLIFCLNHVVF